MPAVQVHVQDGAAVERAHFAEHFAVFAVHAGGTGPVHGEVEALPVRAEGDTVVEHREVVGGHRVGVVAVHHAVAVPVLIVVVAREGAGAVVGAGGRVVLDLVVGGEASGLRDGEPDVLVTAGDRAAAPVLHGVACLGIQVVVPAVLGGGHEARDVVADFAHAVAVAQLELVAEGDVALDVLLRHGGAHGARKHDGGRREQAVAVALEHLEGTAQLLVPEVEVQTQVLGGGGVPGEVRVRDRGGIDTGHDRAVVDPRLVALQVVARVDGRVRTGGAVVTQLTPGCAELEVGDPREVVLDEAFLADAPAHGNRREPAPAARGREAGGGVVTDGGVQQVLALVVVVQVADPRPAGHVAQAVGLTHLVLLFTGEQIRLVQHHRAAGVEVVPLVVGLLVHAHQRDVVRLREGVVVVDGQLHHLAAVRVGGALHVGIVTAVADELVQGSVRVLGEQVVGPLVFRVVGGVIVVAVEGAEVQAFDIRDVISERHRGVQVVPLLLAEAGETAVGRGDRVLGLEHLVVEAREVVVPVDPGLGGGTVGPCLLVHGPDGRERLVLLIHVAGEGDVGAQAVGDLRIHVGTEVPAVVVQGAAAVGTHHVHVTEVEEVLDLLRTAVDGQVVLALRDVVLEQLVTPDGALAGAVAVGHDGVPGIDAQAPVRIVAVEPVVVLLVDEHHVGSGVHRVRDIQEGLPAVVHRQVDIELAVIAGTLAGRDEDDAVRGPHAVDGGGGVLQHGHGLDFIGVHAGEVGLVARNAVHHEQRGAHAADVDRIVEFTRLRGALGDADAGDLAGQHVHDVLVLGDDHLLVGDGRNRTGEGGLLLDTVTDDDRLFQEIGIVPEHDVEGSLRGGHHLIGVADEGDHEIVPRGGGDLEASGRVGHRAAGGTLHDDAGADERFAAPVPDRTPHGTVLGGQGQRQERRQHGQDDM